LTTWKRQKKLFNASIWILTTFFFFERESNQAINILAETIPLLIQYQKSNSLDSCFAKQSLQEENLFMSILAGTGGIEANAGRHVSWLCQGDCSPS
jgi:hypothetical protein